LRHQARAAEPRVPAARGFVTRLPASSTAKPPRASGDDRRAQAKTGSEMRHLHYSTQPLSAFDYDAVAEQWKPA
jgi:hypothetical protein